MVTEYFPVSSIHKALDIPKIPVRHCEHIAFFFLSNCGDIELTGSDDDDVGLFSISHDGCENDLVEYGCKEQRDI